VLKPEPPQPPSNPAPDVRRVQRDDEERGHVARAQRGDTKSFRWLLERHRDRAYGLALRILRSAPDAEDVTQEAFVRVWRALPQFRGDAGFSTWLYRIVARQSFDRLEQLKRRRERETQMEDITALTHAGGAPDAGAAERARRLERLMQGLTPVQRAVVTLFYHEDRSVDQVAEVLGLPENTVKTHLSRARTQLREAWMKGEVA
jgi:RNA polymerase sigma-70 factor (ECF subfamily)